MADAFIPNEENKRNVTHIDKNQSNNHVENLKWVTQSECNMNAKISTRNTSGVKGCSIHKGTGKWQAFKSVDGKMKHLGYFDTLELAQEARNNI